MNELLEAPAIAVKYSCLMCGIRDRELVVPSRDTAVDVVTYLNTRILPRVGMDHRQISPTCRSQKVDLKLPLPAGVGAIGEAVRQ